MGRIDDALRRTRSAPDTGAGAEPGQEVFTPEWDVPTESEPAPPEKVTRLSPGVTAPPTVSRAPGTAHTGLVSFASKWRDRLATAPDGDPALVEQFRRLAATLHHAQHANGLKSVMVTSAMPGDGKTLTAINLALVLVQSYRANVLLVDADLRRPSLPAVGDLDLGGGLSDVLRAPTERKLALVPVIPGLTLLPAGPPIANSLEALTSPRMREILDEATARFDWVIVDAPPVGITTDARLLAEMVGGALFVIRAAETQHANVQKGIDALGREHIIGVVLNAVTDTADPSYYYQYGATPEGGAG